MKKVGMVLEGGGLRGLYTAGVLDTLMDNKIKVDCIIGVSAGALFGVNYFSNQRGRVIRYNKEYCKDKRYMSMRSLILTGNYINKNFAFYRMSTELDQFDNLIFISSKNKFYAVATNISTGEPKYFEITNPIEDMEKLRATSAIPVISKKVKVGDQYYLDGGVSDSIPIDKLIELGYEKRIIVETQPLNYRKKPLKKHMARFLMLRFIKYPKFVQALLNRHKRYNTVKTQIVQMEKDKEVFVIRPSKKLDIDIRNKNPEKYQEVYDLGVKDAEAAIKNLKKYLNKK